MTITSLTDLCLRAICIDKNLERRGQQYETIKNKHLFFPNHWDYSTLEVKITEQSEVVQMTLDPARREFEGQFIMSPLDCLFTQPHFIEVCIIRLPIDTGDCIVQWFFHYYAGLSNAILEVTYPIDNPSALQMWLRTEREWTGRPDSENIVCEFHKTKMNRWLFKHLSQLFIPKSLKYITHTSIQNTWVEIKKIAMDIITRPHSNIQLYINVCEDPTISKENFMQIYSREMESVVINLTFK